MSIFLYGMTLKMAKHQIWFKQCRKTFNHSRFHLIIIQWNLCNPTTECSDKYLWSQGISVSSNKTWVFRHPVQSDTFPWTLDVSDYTGSVVYSTHTVTRTGFNRIDFDAHKNSNLWKYKFAMTSLCQLSRITCFWYLEQISVNLKDLNKESHLTIFQHW